MTALQVLQTKRAKGVLISQPLRHRKFLVRPGVFFFCVGGPHDGVGRVGLGPPVGVFPLFKLEFSQQKKKFSAEITMSTLPKASNTHGTIRDEIAR